MKVNILGSKWTVIYRKREDDDLLASSDGYADESVRLIVIATTEKGRPTFKDYNAYQKSTLRHEIVHAYLFESGLGGCFAHDHYGHDETYVDWIARQFPKIAKTFRELGVQDD